MFTDLSAGLPQCGQRPASLALPACRPAGAPSDRRPPARTPPARPAACPRPPGGPHPARPRAPHPAEPSLVDHQDLPLPRTDARRLTVAGISQGPTMPNSVRAAGSLDVSPPTFQPTAPSPPLQFAQPALRTGGEDLGRLRDAPLDLLARVGFLRGRADAVDAQSFAGPGVGLPERGWADRGRPAEHRTPLWRGPSSRRCPWGGTNSSRAGRSWVVSRGLPGRRLPVVRQSTSPPGSMNYR